MDDEIPKDAFLPKDLLELPGVGVGASASLQATLPPPPAPEEPARVLVVDDIEQNRRVLTRLLSRLGHRVLTAPDGRRALDLLDADPDVDLVLLDVEMPDMTGIEVLGRLRSDARFVHIPVVMVSGLQDMDAIAHCIEAGADDFIHKPFDNRLLKARVVSSLAKKHLHDWRRMHTRALRRDQVESRRLISAMLPEAIAERLRAGEQLIADRFEDVSVLFADIVGFTPRSANTPPEALVRMLNDIFSRCDELAAAGRLEKIKTIGDAYMVVGNLPTPRSDHLEAMADFALRLRDILHHEQDVTIRIGIHCGPVVAGVIGTSKPAYDVWGDTINVASRMESHGAPGEIHVSAEVAGRLAGVMRFESRGVIEIKGRGPMETAFLRGRR